MHHVADTYERLITAALELLDNGGPAAVTLREVGHRAGVSHNTPYRHFDSKRDLLACLAARQLRELTALLDANEMVGTELLASTALTYVSWARARPERFHLTFGAWSDPHQELAAAATEASGTLRDIARRALEDGAAPGHSPERIAYLLWSVAHGAVQLDLSGHLRKDETSPTSEQVVGDFVALLDISTHQTAGKSPKSGESYRRLSRYI